MGLEQTLKKLEVAANKQAQICDDVQIEVNKIHEKFSEVNRKKNLITQSICLLKDFIKE